MLRIFFLILNFLIIEIKLYKKKVEFFIKLINEISLLKLFIYLFINKKIFFFRDKNINFFLKYNQKLWKSNNLSEDKIILVDLTLNRQPIHAICQCILANNLKKINNYKCKAIIKNGDILTKFIARSFLINNFIIIKNANFFVRLNYYLKAINILSYENLEKKLIKYKYNNIEIGKAAYEFAFRNYFRHLPEKKKIIYFIYRFLEVYLFIIKPTKFSKIIILKF